MTLVFALAVVGHGKPHDPDRDEIPIETKRKGNYRQLSRETQETESLLNRPRRPSGFLRASVDHGHGFDLDQRARDGETGHLHQGTGRWVSREELLADLTVAFTIADVRDEDGDLHDIPEAGASGFEDAAHVLEDAAGLSADVVRPDEVPLLVERKLTGDVDRIADAPAMSVAGPRICHADGLNRRARHACLLLVMDCE